MASADSKDGAGVATATHNDIAATTASEMDEDQIPPDDENQSLRLLLFHGQIDGNADTKKMVYVPKPKTREQAQIQGLARLKEMLNDPDGEIAHYIKSTNEWLPKPLSKNETCKEVQHCLTRKAQADVTDKTVPFILATWCMLGGSVPSMWREKVEGSLTDRGKKMLDELENLGGDYDFEFCKRYATEANGKNPNFGLAEAADELVKPDNFVGQTMTRSKHAASPSSLGKHGASSPRQSPAVKLPKTVANEVTQQSGGSPAGGSRGAFKYRSNGNTKIQNKKLKPKIKKLTADIQTQRMETEKAFKELHYQGQALALEAGAGRKKDRIIEDYRVKLERMCGRRDQCKDRISDLKKALDASRQTVEESNANIAALEEVVKIREGVIDDRAKQLDTITAEAILQATTAAAKDKGLATISLTELLDRMFQENDNGLGISGFKDSEDH